MHLLTRSGRYDHYTVFSQKNQHFSSHFAVISGHSSKITIGQTENKASETPACTFFILLLFFAAGYG